MKICDFIKGKGTIRSKARLKMSFTILQPGKSQTHRYVKCNGCEQTTQESAQMDSEPLVMFRV